MNHSATDPRIMPIRNVSDDSNAVDVAGTAISPIVAGALYSRSTRLYIFLILCYCLYAAWYIYQSSFVVDGERYFCLFDDAMISMRYAKNLAGGHGLVWNAGGERVEGITNPLWTIMMAGVHLLPLRPSTMSLPVQVVGAVLLIANAWFLLRIVHHLVGDSLRVAGAALVLTLFYLPLNTWGLQGMETSLLALLVTAGAERAIVTLKSGRFLSAPYILLGVGMLVRLDMIVPLFCLMGYMWFADRRHGGRHMAWGLGVAVSALALQTGFRFWYYGEILPNTYYLKMTGIAAHLRISRGVYVLAKFILLMSPLLFAMPFLLPLINRTSGGRILLVLFLGQISYSIYVGGDAWEWWGGSNRYIVIAMPCFFIAMAIVLGRAWDHISSPAGFSRRVPRHVHVLGYSLLVALPVITVNCIDGPISLAEVLLVKQPLHRDDNQRNVMLAKLAENITGDNARVAVCAAGVFPYFLDRRTEDMLGKCDAYIARTKSRTASGAQKYIDYLPGHRKWDYQYSIGLLRPDLVMQIWGDSIEAMSELRDNYMVAEYSGTRFYVRSESQAVYWDQLSRVLSAPAETVH